ncbi:hypothetical protein [Streptomyces sp. NBC_00076]|uniref:hypothetical protein n=1 Tax=Streptomyces sp. NBC_00076 TaxID=2975642 RepID=UPI0032524BC8
MSVSELASVALGPSGVPFSYGPDGKPVSPSEAAHLIADVERRTLYKSDLKLATGEMVTVRTLCLVFDPDARAGEWVTVNFRPRVWGTALYTPAPENALLEVLVTYDDPAEAVEEHKQAMTMVVVGTNEPANEPGWAAELSWTGPGQ